MKFYDKCAVLLLVGFAFLGSGCSQNPEARKQKYFESGKHYFEQGKYQEAAIEFRNVIQIDANFAPAHYQLAQCLLRQNLWTSAVQELQRTIELDPRNWPARLDLTNFLLEARQFQSAREHAEAILKEDPSQVRAQFLLAQSDAALGNMRAAVEEAQKAVQMAPDTAAPYLTLGLIQEKAEQLTAAEENLQKAVSLDARFLPARLGLGNFYQRQQRWDQAEIQYRAAMEADRKNTIPRAALATLYLAWGKPDLAEQTLQEAKKDFSNNPAGYQILGDFYLATGQSAKAFSEYASLYQEHPGDPAVKKRYVQLLIQNKQLEQATKLNEEILKLDAKDAESLALKGQILNLQQRPGEAVAVLEAAVKGNPEDAAGHFHLGVAYSRTGNLAGAEKEWREAVRLKPAMLEAQQDLATLALGKGDMDLLEQSASAWIQYAPSAPQGYLMRGTAKSKKGDAAAAEKDLHRALELDPQNSVAHTRLGDLRLSQKRYAEAEKSYEQALVYNPRAGEALQGLTAMLLSQKQMEKALRRVELQVAKVPDQSGYQLLLGGALLANRRTAEAQGALGKAIELDKTNLSAFLLLAQVQETTGQPEKAAATYEHSIRENPRDVRPYVAWGVLEQQRGNWQKAQQLYEKALQLQPGHPSAANNLSYLLLENGGDTNYALSLAQIGRRGMPDSANSADTLGWAYYKMSIYESAARLFQEAAKKAPQNPTYHWHLGLAYQKSGKNALARASFERALQLEPKSPRAEQIRQALADLNSRR